MPMVEVAATYLIFRWREGSLEPIVGIWKPLPGLPVDGFGPAPPIEDLLLKAHWFFWRRTAAESLLVCPFRWESIVRGLPTLDALPITPLDVRFSVACYRTFLSIIPYSCLLSPLTLFYFLFVAQCCL